MLKEIRKRKVTWAANVYKEEDPFINSFMKYDLIFKRLSCRPHGEKPSTKKS